MQMLSQGYKRFLKTMQQSHQNPSQGVTSIGISKVYAVQEVPPSVVSRPEGETDELTQAQMYDTE